MAMLVVNPETAAPDGDAEAPEWTRGMISQVAADATEALGTALSTSILNNRRIKSYRQAVDDILEDYVPEDPEAAREVIYSILRDRDMMLTWANVNGRQRLLDAAKSAGQRKPRAEASAAPDRQHPAWEMAGLVRGDRVLVNVGSLDRPRLVTGIVRRTRSSDGEALVAPEKGGGVLGEARWHQVNDDAVGIIAKAGAAAEAGDVPISSLAAAADAGGWAAAGILGADGRASFPSRDDPDSDDSRSLLMRGQDQADPVNRGIKSLESDLMASILTGLAEDGMSPMVIDHPAHPAYRLRASAVTGSGDAVLLETTDGEDWTVRAPGSEPVDAKGTDLADLLARM